MLLLIGFAPSTHAEDALYKVGDQVQVDIYGNGKEVYKGEVTEIYRHSTGITYGVKWDTGDGFKNSQMSNFPADRLSLPGGGKPKPRPKPVKPDPEPQPDNTPDDPDATPELPDDPPADPDATPDGGDDTPPASDGTDYFVGTWKVTKWGGGTEIERGGDIYKEWLLYVTPGAPLTINDDETFEWFDAEGKPMKGKWRPLRPDEDIIAGGKAGIMLLNALGGKDWQVDFRGIKDGKDLAKVKSHMGSFDLVRDGESKGEPAWNRVQFDPGDEVIVIIGRDNKEYNGTVVKVDPPRKLDGIILYYVKWTEDGDPKDGYFQAIKLRKR